MLLTFDYPVDHSIRAGFGWRGGVAGRRRFSKGVTFEVPYGAPIRAAQDGQVIEVQRAGLVIEHAPGVATYYARVGQVLAVRGQLIKRGQIVARAGNLPGLYFAVWLGDRFVNPEDLFLGINATGLGVVPGGHAPGGQVNLYTLREELTTYVVLGALMLVARWGGAK